jgi:hypothetical protein
VEENVHRCYGVGVYPGITQSCSEPSRTKMSSPESVASVVNNVCSHCASGNIEDPSSYGPTRVVRLSKNQCSNAMSCKTEKCQSEVDLLASSWNLLVKWVVDEIHSRTGGVGPDVQLRSKR